MMTPLLCESPERRHPQEKCASKCIRGTFTHCLHLFFSTNKIRMHFGILDLKFENLRFENWKNEIVQKFRVRTLCRTQNPKNKTLIQRPSTKSQEQNDKNIRTTTPNPFFRMRG